MDTQTWSGALKQVRATLTRWPIIVALPVGLILPRYPEPWGTSLALIFVGFCCGQSIVYAFQIWRGLKAYKKAELQRAAVMDDALKALEYWQQETARLLARQGELYIQGKTEEVKALQSQVNHAVEQQGKYMIRAAGLEKPDTK